MDSISISVELTPNPNSLKFSVSVPVLPSGSIPFDTVDAAKNSRLASALFETPGVISVMLGTNFVTVSKLGSFEWTPMIEPITNRLKGELAKSDPLVDPEWLSRGPAEPVVSTEIEMRIKEILETEIRPAIAMDGGDVVFYGYENGIVTLHLQGSCSSCPSATMTLKFGIENRLKEEIPEIIEVVQI